MLALEVASRVLSDDPWPLDVATVRDRIGLDDAYPSDERVQDYIEEAIADIEGRTSTFISRGTVQLACRIFDPRLFGSFNLPGFNAALTGVRYTAADASDETDMDDLGDHWWSLAKGPAAGLMASWKPSESPPMVEPGSIVTLTFTCGLPDDKRFRDIIAAILLRIRQLHDGFDYSRERSIFSTCIRYRQLF